MYTAKLSSPETVEIEITIRKPLAWWMDLYRATNRSGDYNGHIADFTHDIAESLKKLEASVEYIGRTPTE